MIKIANGKVIKDSKIISTNIYIDGGKIAKITPECLLPMKL